MTLHCDTLCSICRYKSRFNSLHNWEGIWGHWKRKRQSLFWPRIARVSTSALKQLAMTIFAFANWMRRFLTWSNSRRIRKFCFIKIIFFMLTTKKTMRTGGGNWLQSETGLQGAEVKRCAFFLLEATHESCIIYRSNLDQLCTAFMKKIDRPIWNNCSST